MKNTIDNTIPVEGVVVGEYGAPKYALDRKQLTMRFGTKSDIKGLTALMGNWLYLLVGLYLTSRLTPFPSTVDMALYLPLSFLIGCSLRGFDNLTHEASHKNVFKTKSLHSFLEFSFAYLVFKTIEDYGPPHFEHHRNHRADKANDPDTKQNIRWGVEALVYPVRWKLIVWFYFIRLIVGYYVFDNIRYNLIPHLKSDNSIIARLAFWVIIIAIVAITHSWGLLLFGYIIPAMFWLPYIRFVTESSKHNNVNLESDFGNSRNNIGWFHQLLLHPHNDGFHQMHHFASSIPFYNLKKAYRYAVKDPAVRAQVIESRSPFQTIIQSFKLK